MDDPVFVIGTARSGLTPLMQLIAYHRDFTWPTQYNKRWPRRYAVSFLCRLIDLPLFNSRMKYWKYIPQHGENYEFWRRHYYGFTQPFRDLVAEDVTPSVERDLRRAVREMKRYAGKTRFIAEYSGWSRIGFMNAIFPNAKFVHIVRDGRAVANSYVNTPWWRGWQGIYQWRWGIPSAQLQAQLAKYDYSFLALAGVHWKILVNNILDKSESLPGDRVLRVRYEDMVKAPHDTAFRCLDFLGVDAGCERFRKHLSTVRIVNANETAFRIAPWRENMSAKQIDMLNDLLEDELNRLDYR